MRIRIRSIEPHADDATLEQLVLGTPAATADPSGAGGDARFEVVRRPLAAADLGPNGDVVLDLLGRAARLTAAERRALEKSAAWRWWMVTPLVGTTVQAARAAALVVGRAEGRAAAIDALETAVATIVRRLEGARGGRSRLPAVVSNAGLAVLVRDLLEPEAFETLFGPWREVMHH